MAIYNRLPIYQASYQLLLAVTKLMPSVPRDCRYTLGQELRAKLLEIIVLIYRANRQVEKAPTIGQMRERLLEAQVCLRLMSDMKYISESQYLQLAEQTTCMSKQMVAWQKSRSSGGSKSSIQS